MFFKLLLVLLFLHKNKSYAESSKQYASIPELFYYDNYDNCMLREDEAFYCQFTYVLQPVNEENPPEIWNVIKNLSAIEGNYRHDHLRHFICVPKTCPEVNKSDESDPAFIEALQECYNEKFKETQLKGTITEIHCETQNPKNPVDWLDLMCAILFVVYLLFVLFATRYEVIAGYQTPEEYQKQTSTPAGKFLSAFSLSKNWKRLTTIQSTPEVDKFRSIQSIRFLHSAIVVLAHTILGFMATPISNTRYAETMLDRSISIFFGTGHLCMSSFFFISSFLLSNGLFTYMKDGRRLDLGKIALMFAVRCIRLLPNMIFMILFHATWLRHLSSGPGWTLFIENEFNNCRKNGWTNLFFINNFIYPDNMCLSTSWFMALSTQYFILSLLFIWLLKKYEKYTWHLLGAAVLLNIIGTFIQNYYYDFPALLIYPVETYFGLNKFLRSREFKYKLGSFVGNLTGEIFGIAFGYYFNKHQREKPGKKFFDTKFRIFIFWAMFAVISGCFIVPGVVLFCYSNVHSPFWASLYMALSRPIFCLAFGIIVFGFTERVGGILLRLFHWTPFYVLGRLTYSVYLVHMSIVIIRPASSRYPAYISTFNIMTSFNGDMILIYTVAMFLTLLVELPVSALEKSIFVFKEVNTEQDSVTRKKEE